MTPALFRAAAIAAALLAVPQMSVAGEITLVISNIEHGEGMIRAAAWSDPERFPKPDGVIARAEAKADPAGVALTLSALPDAPIAVMVYHDEDGDGEMDRFLGMWPTEGYAVSNAPDIAGPPEFEPAAVTPPFPGTLEMPLKY